MFCTQYVPPNPTPHPVWLFLVREVAAVHEAKVFLKACSGAAAVEAFMSRQHITSQTVPRELEGVALLCEEAETEAQQALRPVVSSAETFQWSVDLISTKEVCACLQRRVRSGGGHGLKHTSMIHVQKITRHHAHKKRKLEICSSHRYCRATDFKLNKLQVRAIMSVGGLTQ